MQPWVIYDDSSALQGLLWRLEADLAGAGHGLWDIIGREEPFHPEEDALWAPRVVLTPSGGLSYDVMPDGWAGNDAGQVMIGSAKVIRGGGGDDVILPGDLHPVSAIHGDQGDDFLAGDLGANLLAGGAGDDTLVGGDGDDRLVGGGGANLLVGGGGDDMLSAHSADAPLGGETADAAWIAAKRLVGDEMQGGLGHDTLLGSYGADRLYGGAGDDRIEGNDGDDRLYGGEGYDLLSGGDGDDRIEDGAGFGAAVSGGRGDDVIVSTASAQGDLRIIKAGAGADAVACGAADDWVDGGAGRDVIRLGAGDDQAAAVWQNGSGDDAIFGEAGRDRLSGGFGRDTLDGGAGNDRLHGGAWDDVLTGGSEADVFVLRDMGGIDTITDFGAFDRLEIARGINGLALASASDLAGRAFLGDGFVWIDLEGDVPALNPDAGHGVVLLGVAAEALSALLDHRVDIA